MWILDVLKCGFCEFVEAFFSRCRRAMRSHYKNPWLQKSDLEEVADVMFEVCERP
jgi:hypothetical protein